jgi:hypothetical protein
MGIATTLPGAGEEEHVLVGRIDPQKRVQQLPDIHAGAVVFLDPAQHEPDAKLRPLSAPPARPLFRAHGQGAGPDRHVDDGFLEACVPAPCADELTSSRSSRS